MSIKKRLGAVTPPDKLLIQVNLLAVKQLLKKMSACEMEISKAR